MAINGVTFGTQHSLDDLNLILSKIDIPPAKPKTSYIDIPGGNGSIDLTEANGEIVYEDRTLSFTFTVHPDESATFDEVRSDISNQLNGQNCKITLDKDDDYYFYGRVTVDDYRTNKKVNEIAVKARVQPYKYKQNPTMVKFALSAQAKTVNISNSRKSVSPTVTVSEGGSASVEYEGNTFTFTAGTQRNADLRFTAGNNRVKISGSGTITFIYQEGSL